MRALYRRNIKIAKLDSWKRFCNNNVEKYGTLFRTVFDKFVDKGNMELEVPSVIMATMEQKIDYLLSETFGGFEEQETLNWPIDFRNYIGDSTYCIDKRDNYVVLYGLKNGKAPGLDGIMYPFWKN